MKKDMSDKHKNLDDDDGLIHHDDDDFSVEEEKTAEEIIRKLRTRLKACEKERREFLDGWQRTRADYLNQRRLVEEVRDSESSQSENKILGELIAVLDSFDMAFSDTARWEAVDEVWRRGVENIHAQLMRIFDEYGVVQDNPLGELFDPAQHDPVESVSTAEPEKDTRIAEVLQRGYKRNNTIIRPARVKVFQYVRTDS